MACKLPGCYIAECDADTSTSPILRHEAWLRYTNGLRDLHERLLPKATLKGEFRRDDFNAAWDAIQARAPESPIEIVTALLSCSSPHAYPNGWTVRREGQREVVECVIRVIRAARILSFAHGGER